MELDMEQVRYCTYHFEIMVEMILSIKKVDWDYLSKNLCAKFCLNRLECASSEDIMRFFPIFRPLYVLSTESIICIFRAT